MKIAVCSDEPYAVHQDIARLLESRGHEIERFGAFGGGPEQPWALVAEEAARAVAGGSCDEGVFLCWSGTGISMAANKVPGIRAALCFEPGGARAGRLWNHANVLCLSNRLLSSDLAREILDAWLEPIDPSVGQAGVDELARLETRYLRERD